MGRGKIDIRKIESPTGRQATFSKRKQGLMKKAMEISTLCDAKVSLIIFCSKGKLFEYCSPNTTLLDILQNYHKLPDVERVWDAKHQNLHNEIDRIQKENDEMRLYLRQVKGEDITSLKYEQLRDLEGALTHGLSIIRDKKSELTDNLRRRVKMLHDQNQELQLYEQHQEMTMHNHQKLERNYSASFPFEIRLAPL